MVYTVGHSTRPIDALVGLLREAAPDSPNTFWRNAQFRGYADALVARGVEVRHILGPGQATRHALNPGARVEPDGRLVYPAPA